MSADTENNTKKYEEKIQHIPGDDVESIASSTHKSMIEPPDGGRSWLVLAGCWCGLFSTGTFLRYYNEDVFPNQMTALSWIGSLWLAMSVILGPFFNYLVARVGYRWLLGTATILCCLASMMASLATEIWHLYITQGAMAGLGASLVWFPCVSAAQQWFSKRRGLSVGIALSGSGCGGLVFSNLVQAVSDSLDYRWALRIMGFIILALLTFSTCVVRPLNLPDKHVPIINLKPFKNFQFCLLFIVQFITNFAFNIPSSFLPSYASEIGAKPMVSANMGAIMSGVMVIGKIGSGLSSDYIGRANVTALVILISGILCLALWLNAYTEPAVWAFGILFGIFGGGYMAMVPALLAQVVGLEEIEAANGLLFFAWLVGGIFGSPIASDLIDENSPDGPHYDRAIIFGGVMMIGSGLIALTVRVLRGGFNPFKKV
ncbi:monocarboxylate transporter [Lichtheimia corymbifera JMRC:FSU:9682]|uniref:Monocarboxylate transporter n=1 Tax=Lichtheimia corymbifera JMRC:FSU:9682 TaxID=1263082 RepID=A0A068S8F0_9FUNG|nr:monocarboxylate transporter [Lichtheimia corymbifera JMRC:FSU:9682]